LVLFETGQDIREPKEKRGSETEESEEGLVDEGDEEE
jgi:hypothetical protein